MAMLLPRYYTETEGGQWLLWDKGPVDEEDLVVGKARTIPVNGALVHSMLFARKCIWDTVGGYRPGMGWRL